MIFPTRSSPIFLDQDCSSGCSTSTRKSSRRHFGSSPARLKDLPSPAALLGQADRQFMAC